MKEGDLNTKFFHRVANGRRRKNIIFKMQIGDSVSSNVDEIKGHITNYYKNLFGQVKEWRLTLYMG